MNTPILSTLAGIAALGICMPASQASAATETVLYSFAGIYGSTPSGLVPGPNGLLYGTESGGGGSASLFTITLTGHKHTVYTFPTSQTIYLDSPPVFDNKGNLYGTSLVGGPANAGFIYKLTPTGRESILYTFKNTTDGSNPGGLRVDSSGNLYGSTEYGGRGGPNGYGAGTVFRITLAGAFKTLYTFNGTDADGVTPTDVLQAPDGIFYGTTLTGGTGSCLYYKHVHGCGTLFSLSPTGTKSILHEFTRTGSDGGFPSGLVMDNAGKLFGTTSVGGTADQGSVFRFSPAGDVTTVYSFAGGADGFGPGGLLPGANGVLYGVTSYDSNQAGGGTIFSLTTGAAPVHRVLYRFGDDTVAGSVRGVQPNAPLYRDAAGKLYGTTSLGGQNNVGVMFKLTP